MPQGPAVRTNPRHDRVIGMVDEVFANELIHPVALAREVRGADRDELAIPCGPSDLACTGERRVWRRVKESSDDQHGGIVACAQSSDRPGSRALGGVRQVLDEDLEFGIVHGTSVRPAVGAPLTLG